LIAQVDPEGAVRSVKVVSGNRALASAAVRAIRQWRYRPFLEDGKAVATETNIIISFVSEDAISMSFPPSLSATR
jgi:protein TonB